jgi:GT2 family glycosyltransferase
MSAATVHPVTVIVPVYGDLPSLVACVESLKQNVDQTVHSVLLVNDVGPDADAIEAALVALIEGEPAFRYERNPSNLGFVGNCNRAVFELDQTDNDVLLLNSDTVTTPGFLEELVAVLHLSPDHGAVCARSNNATIASLPFKLRDPSVGRSLERSAAVHAALVADLPRFGIMPVAMGFCILMRRDLVRDYGLFDEIFAPGYGEENDFCLRIGQHGFASVVAHRALVFHQGARSFVGARREALRSAHEKIVVERYPFYTTAVQSYLHLERDPVDAFADALVPGDTVVRALIDLGAAPNARLGSWENEVLAAANARAATDAVITVSVPDRLYAGLSRRFPALTVVRQSRLDGLWDVALSVGGTLTPEREARLNRTSLRWVLGMPATDAARFADAVIAPTSLTAPALLSLLVDQWGRSLVDLPRLRARWSSVTAYPDYLSGAGVPRESRARRLLRRAERAAPNQVGLAKGLVKKALGRA